MKYIDILDAAIQLVVSALPSVEFRGRVLPVQVSDSLPPVDDLMPALPCIVIDVLPGDPGEASWGGVGMPVRLDLVTLDVEVFAESRAVASVVSDKLRRVLHQLPHLADSGATSVDCPMFATREDLNPHVRVLGATCDIIVRG